MRATRVLAIAAILGIAFSFRASANVVYDSETTNTWFSVDMSKLTTDALKGLPWTPPSPGGEAVVESSVIKLDTDLDDPLMYTAQDNSADVAIVAAEMTATVNASVPDLTDIPQAALCVIGTATATNWVGLVGDGNGGTNWVTFSTSVPVAGETYSVRIEFDQRQPRQIRYRVGDTVLGNGWYPNPKASATNIKSVSFSGTGDISGLGGSNVIENAATFNGVGYQTFEAALANAEAAGTGWNSENPIVLYTDATYQAKTGTAYFDANGKNLTISGGIYTRNGNTYEITANGDCEAYIDSAYYKTLDEALAAGAGQTVTINKNLSGDRMISITTSLTLAINEKTVNCTQLSVAADATLTLNGDLAVTTAYISGTVAGGTLTVNGTLTGVNIAKLTLGEGATFVYVDTALGSSTALTLGTALKIGGLDSAAIDTVVIDNAAINGKDVSMFTANPALPEGLMLSVNGNVLKVVKEPPAIEIEIDKDTMGYDFTNGTVNVKTTVMSGKSGVLRLTVYDFDGSIRDAVNQEVSDSTTAVSWDLADLTAGGTYSYEIVINDGSKDIGTAYGEFTAANWGDDIWFGADASKGEGLREFNGEWEVAPAVDLADNVYVIEEDSVFKVAVGKQELGSNRVTRVDAKVTFESLVDGEVDVPADDAISGFVATKEGWKALADGAWVSLTGGPTPVAGTPYVVRAEVDFISDPKRVRYLVSEDDGVTFIPLFNGTAQWIALANTTKSLLAKVELQGSGRLAKFEARVADKAVAMVEGTEYDSMEDALEAAKDNGKTITLLTNATVDPKEPGTYDIAPGDNQYASGGQILTEKKAIVIDESGKIVVRPSTDEMEAIKTPDNATYKNINSLRAFLERNKVEAYTTDKGVDAITSALNEVPEDKNGLELWQDYVMGIEPADSVAPVTIPTGDTDPDAITLAIPAIDSSKYSGDYTIGYKVGDEPSQSDPQAIKVPLTTGTYTIKATFTPATAQ